MVEELNQKQILSCGLKTFFDDAQTFWLYLLSGKYYKKIKKY